MAEPYLRHFKPDEVKISKEQAARVMKYFFPDLPIQASLVTNEDAGFAQALLIQAIDSSNEMGFVHVLFDKAYMKPPVDFSIIKDIAVSLCKQAFKDWFRHATGDDLKDPKIYDAVRGQIIRNFRSVWADRINGTGELTF
jgi:hypothetical protein